MKNATLRQLRVFATVAKHLSFVRAAEELHLTPPAVSMQVKELEREVGLPLFDRAGKTVSLTITGEYLLAHARRMLAVLKDAEDQVARFRGLTGGRLVIGMVSTAKHFLPRLLARFRAEHPDLLLDLKVGNREQLVACMQRNEVDLAVMGRPPRDWPTRAEPFAHNPLVLATAVDHPFVRLELVPAAALAREPLVVREPGSGTRAALEEYLREHRVDVRPAMEMASNETIKQVVMAGLGVSLLSLHTIGLELRHGLIATPDVEGLPVIRRWHVVMNHGKQLSPAAEAFRYFVLERGEAFIAAMPGHGAGRDRDGAGERVEHGDRAHRGDREGRGDRREPTLRDGRPQPPRDLPPADGPARVPAAGAPRATGATSSGAAPSTACASAPAPAAARPAGCDAGRSRER